MTFLFVTKGIGGRAVTVSSSANNSVESYCTIGLSINSTFNSIPNGTYYIGAYADHLYIETESNENNNDAAFAIQAEAYLDPTDSLSYKVGGNWIKLEENIDYEIDRLLGWVRLNSVQNAIAIAYTTTTFNPINQTFGQEQNETGTNFKAVYDECKDNSQNYMEECVDLITLKLLKDNQPSTPTSPTWPLMFKNVYSLGGSNIEPSGLELEIVRDLGGGDEKTHSENGNSWLSIFGLDSEDESQQEVPGGDGKIDIYGSILNLTYGELILPTYLPFAFDNECADPSNRHGYQVHSKITFMFIQRDL